MKQLIYIFILVGIFSCSGSIEPEQSESYKSDGVQNRDIFIVGQVETIDPENDNLIYSIVEQEFNYMFKIDRSGEISIDNDNLQLFSSRRTWFITVKVSDGELTTKKQIRINVKREGRPESV